MALTPDDIKQLKEVLTEHRNHCVFSQDEISAMKSLSKMHETMTEQFSKTAAIIIMVLIGGAMYMIYNLKGLIK